jgi:hypothetical protein
MLATKVMMEAKAATSRSNSVISSLLFRYVFILFPSCSAVNKKNEDGTKYLCAWRIAHAGGAADGVWMSCRLSAGALKAAS